MTSAPAMLKRFLITATLWCFLLVIVCLLLPFFLVAVIVRYSEAFYYHLRYSARKIDSTDILFMWQNRNISGVLQLNGEADLQDFRRLIKERLVEKRDNRGKLIYPQVRQYVYPGLINYYWRNVKYFDIKNHVYYLQRQLITSRDELEAVISNHQNKLFSKDSKSSPWEFVLIPFQTKTGVRKTIVLFSLKHLIADGSALAYFLIHELSDTGHETGTMIKTFSHNQRLLLNLKALWYLPLAILKTMFGPEEKNCLHTLKSSDIKNYTWSNPIDLNTVKKIKNNLQTTVNDVLVGCFSKSISDYFQSTTSTNMNRSFTTIFAVDTRSSIIEAEQFGNKVAGVIVPLPINSTGITDSVLETKKIFDEIKNLALPISIFLGWRFMSFLSPGFLSKYSIFHQIKRTTAIMSNLMGAQYPVYINGHIVDFITYWPPGTHTQTMAVSFCSYNEEIRVAVECDSSVLKDGSVITQLFEKNIKELDNLSTV